MIGARVAIAGVSLALLAVAVLLGVAGTEARPSLLRHAYVLPVGMAALRFGLTGGGLAALGATILDAPRALSRLERYGFTEAAAEEFTTSVLLIVVGALGGRLVTQARTARAHADTLRETQRVLAASQSLDEALTTLAACLSERLRGSAVALVVRDGRGLRSSDTWPVALDSAAARACRGGAALFVRDVGDRPRPHRVFVAPLAAGGAPVGALVVERLGELGAGERATLAALAIHVGLGMENARLTALQRRAAEELAEKVASATRRLEEADRAKSAFVAVTSHELRTPLTALLGFGELLSRRRFPPDETQRLAAIIHREVERLVRIVDDLLDLSRLERGFEPALSRTALAVEPAIESALELFRRTPSGPRIVVECAEPLPCMHADPDAFDRILKNLVSNALKYSPPESPVRVQARATGAFVAFAVEDEGYGISAEALPHIFEPYYRARDAPGAARGVGLGLAVVKSLVEAHGGAIRVDGSRVCGTRMTFELPALP